MTERTFDRGFDRGRFPLTAMGIVLVAMAACAPPEPPFTNQPQPDAPLGFVALDIDGVVPPRFQGAEVAPSLSVAATWDGPNTDPAISVAPSGAVGIFVRGDATHVFAQIVVTNGTSAPLENLVLIAYGRDEFRSGSAVSQPLTVTGVAAPDSVVRAIRPTQPLYAAATAPGSDALLFGDPERSDLVVFEESEVPSLAEHDFVETVFPYGFSVRDIDDPTSRTVPAGGSGQAYVAFALPRSEVHEVNLASFTWNAVLMALDHVRVTQAPQENHAAGWSAVLERAGVDAADVVMAIGSGIRTTASEACGRVMGVRNVRIAGTGPDDLDFATILPDDGDPEFAGCEGAP